MASYDDTATVSGSVVSFSDGADEVGLKSCVVSLSASLSGYSEVNAKQAKKNLLNPSYFSSKPTVYTINQDGSITVIASEDSAWSTLPTMFLKAGTYTLSRQLTGSTCYIRTSIDNYASNALAIYNARTEASFTLADDAYIKVKLGVGGTSGTYPFTDKYQLEVGSSASAWEAYTAPTTHTANLGRTIYGGTADIVTGEGEDENGNAFTFTPINPTPETAKGSNTFWSDQGNTELHYYKDGYGFTSVTIHKETPEGEPVEQTAKLHKIVYGGLVDVISGKAEPKNLIELYTRSAHNGVNYSINADGSLHREGTASPSTSFNNGNATTYSACPYKLSKGTYTITVRGNQASGGYLSLGMRKTDDTQLTSIIVTGNTSKTFTVDEDIGAWYWISLPNGISANDDVYVQLEKGSESTEHAPYFDPFSFPPISMETDEGENTLYADQGDSAIVYRKAVE